MKLAVALQERADLNIKIEDLKDRIERNVLVQEGEAPTEEPKSLKKELDSCIERLAYLIAAINKTNCVTMVEGKTITELLARKDALGVKVSAYRDTVYTGNSNTNRARGTEIKIMPVIDVKAWQKETDETAKEIRLIDNKIQETNWTTELIE
ncbi:DIP1984 family protein [Lachnoanaerobaculum gingivalis]|uniref:DIP1984 family protein n=1 Tax=Lachnoanaerobaculum gingivalis TaxID=2490855 RepID=UPI0024A65374|nr:DIP1984 family protein [Lachnoanaerobaculum gingivalis]WHE88010.1 DIP1984 family protein [Lachnoanaerobaculum gingivalis]